MRRAQVLVVATGKGGVGKTAVSLQLAGRLAQSADVILVDLDVQADCTSGLGIRGSDPRNDQGANLFAALTKSEALKPVSTRWEEADQANPVVFERERLRIVPGGESMEAFLPWAVGKSTPDTELDTALEPLRAQCDWVVLDCPPMDTWTQRQALNASDWLIVPVSDDHDEMRGLDRILRVVSNTARVRLLGAVLARMPANAKVVIQETREAAERVMNGAAPVLGPVIRESVEFGRAKEMGLTVGEYASWASSVGGQSAAKPILGLAYDYTTLADKVVQEIFKRRAEQ